MANITLNFKEFEVTVTETMQKIVTVEAASREDAQALVEEMWNRGDVILNAEDFIDVEFKSDGGREKEQARSIEVLLVEPGRYARMAAIGADLKSMQKIVGGSIQAAAFFRDPVCIVCNEEGKLHDLLLNRAVRDDSGKMIDVIAGTFFVCGSDGEKFTSLPKELRQKYEDKFRKPETFLNLGRKCMAIPTAPAASKPKPDKEVPNTER